MPTLTASTDLVNADGSFNLAMIASVAHAKARADVARTVCCYAGIDVRCTGSMGTWNAQYIAAAATVDARALKIPASESYRAALSRALTDYWFRAREFRKRALADIARAAAVRPAPMFLMAAE